MSPSPVRSILERRVIVVSGKGGAGKTTVSAALALAARDAGDRVLLAEVLKDGPIVRNFEPEANPVDYAGRELRPGLTVMHIDPYEALSEYVRLQVGLPRALTSWLRSRSFEQLMDAAPGWRELVVLGKVWHLEQMRDEENRRSFDRIVIDAPASGHGLTFLDVPRVVVSALRGGPLRDEAARVEALVRDPDRTILVPVSLAEELAVQETAELVERVRADVGIHVEAAIANAVSSPPFAPPLKGLAEELEALPAREELGDVPAPGILAACARHLESRAQLHEHYRGELAKRTSLPVVALPLLPEGVRNAKDLQRLANILRAASAVEGESGR
ncbi:MAG: ArsA family ATPase [Myxococcota bacterium]|nr:ArsA family ATPase [Myxococcota bacterium]